MHEFPWMWVVFGTLIWLFFVRPGRARACQGRWSMGEPRHSIGQEQTIDRPRRRAGRGDLDSALAERDALIAKLEERVRVLERIATDDSARLRAEIDSLRDPPASGRL